MLFLLNISSFSLVLKILHTMFSTTFQFFWLFSMLLIVVSGWSSYPFFAYSTTSSSSELQKLRRLFCVSLNLYVLCPLLAFGSDNILLPHDNVSTHFLKFGIILLVQRAFLVFFLPSALPRCKQLFLYFGFVFSFVVSNPLTNQY